MSQTLQLEIDPLRVSGEVVGSVLVAMDILVYSREEYPKEPAEPVCLIAAAHTNNLSSISKAYTKLYVAGRPSAAEEKIIMRDFSAYLDMFEGGTLAVHYGASDSPDEGFDVPYLLARAKNEHPELYPALRRALGRFKRHDTCLYIKENTNLPSAELDYVESYYGLARKTGAIIPDVKGAMDDYWRSGDTGALKNSLTNVYNCLRIAQSQIKKTICCTDIPL
jgi:DNA polymerase elongation subunit (family B)